MKRKNLYLVAAVVLGVGLLPAANGEIQAGAPDSPIVVGLDNVTVSECDEVWSENGVDLSFVATTMEDACTQGTCYFGIEPGAVWLFPSRLQLDFGALACTVTKAEVDIIDYCGAGCTRAFLYEGGTTVDYVENTQVSTPETLTLSSGGYDVDSMDISSCEGKVLEVRLSCDLVCTDDDGDGYAVEGGECGPVDCDDTNPEVNPGAIEGPENPDSCIDGLDNDCDGLIDASDCPCFIGIVL